MFRMLNPWNHCRAVGRKKFFDFVILAVFLLFFYGPLTNLLMLAFAQMYNYPDLIPASFGFKWWAFVTSQKTLVSAVGQSFMFALATTILSLALCLPAAYGLARFKFPGRRLVMFSFLLTNAFPKIGLYTSIGIMYYKLNLMGTFPGVVIIHMINTMMFMVWIPTGSFSSVHRQQEEAARDSGAGPLRTFFRVTMPMAMPGIAVASIYTFLGSMDEAQGTLLVGIPQFQTMPVMMYTVISDYNVMAAAVYALMMIIPTVVLLVLLRRYVGPEAISSGFKLK
ncbi:ABC transporter permease [Bacillota bacterium Meth-B3]|nr:carbohydrate ABC transporter permease [Eubacteriales bacterium]